MTSRRTVLVVIVSSILMSAIAAADEKKLLDDSKWPEFVADRKLAVKDGDSKLASLLKRRYNAALGDLRERYTFWLQGACSLESMIAAAQRVAAARLDVSDPKTKEITLLKQQLAFARAVESNAEYLAKKVNRARNVLDLKYARYVRLDAELKLARARSAKAPKSKR